MTRPSSYVEPHGCHNCGCVFDLQEYDEGSAWFCTHDAPPRPACLSVYMGEYPDPDLDIHQYTAMWAAWQEWSEGREVRPWGCCRHWREA